jgi:hypothetical protein
MAHDRNSFIKYKQINSPKLVYLRNDTTQEIVGVGDVNISLSQGEIITICNVLVIYHINP